MRNQFIILPNVTIPIPAESDHDASAITYGSLMVNVSEINLVSAMENGGVHVSLKSGFDLIVDCDPDKILESIMKLADVETVEGGDDDGTDTKAPKTTQ